MIRLICGPKGTGKTKMILQDVNSVVDTAKGDIVYITEKKFDTRSVSFNVRVLYTTEFGVDGVDCFRGFIAGLVAGNADIEYLYIDGLSRIVGIDSDTTKFFEDLIALERAFGFKTVITISKPVDELPEIARAYAI